MFMTTDIKYKKTILEFLDNICPDWASEEDKETFAQTIFDKCGDRLEKTIEEGMLRGYGEACLTGRIKGVIDAWVIK